VGEDLPRDAQILKYWERYSDPVARLALSATPEFFTSAVVIPAKNEGIEVLDRLIKNQGGYCGGAARLVVLVVNEHPTSSEQIRAVNTALLRHVFARASRSDVWSANLSVLHAFDEAPGLRILTLNLCSEEFRLGEKEGVGRARKIGSDLALALYAEGRLRGRFLGSTDCDVVLPSDYFEALETEALNEDIASALLFPYEHFGAEGDGVARSMCEIEVSFRYYVLGLARAGSPYAYHSLGSALAVSLPHYAQARGFPNRAAGEDFYILAKLAKLAPLRRCSSPRIRIITRVSDRVPFGTGLALDRALNDSSLGNKFQVNHPESFLSLGRVLARLEQAASAFPDSLGFEDAGLNVFERRTFEKIWAAISPHLSHCPSSAHRVFRVHECFDPLATLQFIHAAHREGGFLRPTLAEAMVTFFGFSPTLDCLTILNLLREMEESLGRSVGPVPRRNSAM
jgi:hypothetical protein